MKQTRLYLTVSAVLSAVASMIDPIFHVAARGLDFALDRLTLAADALAPMSETAMIYDGVPLSPGREIRHLSQHSVHSRAMPPSMQGDPGDPEDDDDGTELRDNGLRRSMNC